MKKSKLLIFSWAFLFVCTLIGGFLGIYLIGKNTGEYHIEWAISIIGGSVGGFFIYLLFYMWSKKRNGNVPDFDERSVILMKRYFMIVLYFILIGSGAVLLVLYSMGVQSIETGILIVCLIVLYMLIGIGALITKRL
jgi:heme A synthase